MLPFAYSFRGIAKENIYFKPYSFQYSFNFFKITSPVNILIRNNGKDIYQAFFNFWLIIHIADKLLDESL